MVNLALNARDAMPEGGRLAIETANQDISPQQAQTLEIAPGPFVELRVRDTGVGIAPELQGRIFEPFFTTKPKGAGTGLGLSMVYGFVRQSGGAVSVTSAPGHGTTFSLLLPRTDDTTANRTPTPKTLLPQAQGSGTILIAEDERALRRLSATVLGQAGYQTLEAADGQQALDLFTVHAHSIVIGRDRRRDAADGRDRAGQAAASAEAGAADVVRDRLRGAKRSTARLRRRHSRPAQAVLTRRTASGGRHRTAEAVIMIGLILCAIH